MATRTWVGDAVNIKDKWTITVANTWATGDTGTITIDGNDLVVTIGTLVTTAQVATSLKQAWEAESFTDTTASASPSGGGTSIPQMSAITATVSGSTVILTADTAGVPHTISVSESTAGDGTLAIAHTTTATGKNYWDNTDNWLENAVPVNGDDVIIDRPVSISYGIDQNTVTLASLTISERFTSSATIGLPFRNAAGYEEYREDQLKISATTITCRGTSGLIKINVGSVATTLYLYSTGTSADTGRAAFQFVGTSASNVVNCYGGDLGIAANNGESATVATTRQDGGTLTGGTGATLTTFNKQAGTATLASSTTALLNESGTLNIRGGTHTAITHLAGTLNATGTPTLTLVRNSSGTVNIGPQVTLVSIENEAGTVNSDAGCTNLTTYKGTVTFSTGNISAAAILGGTFNYEGTGTITAVNAENCTLNFSGTTAACTVVTINEIARPITIIDPTSRVAWTNGLPTGGTIKYTAA